MRELPPRARRILDLAKLGHGGGGTTSACAENTYQQPTLYHGHQNYLRVRGEYHAIGDFPGADQELPPRARRILCGVARTGATVGTTSACAENTRHASVLLDEIGNYLRVRGEYRMIRCRRPGRKELPPRARRIRRVPRANYTGFGTTSACAENTAQLIETLSPRGNYLRVRGEYAMIGVATALVEELPPRARRIPGCPDETIKVNGTTSACAENTQPECEFISHPQNYLRVRGEYHFRSRVRCFRWELPPRARRIPNDIPDDELINGTTSACAENTVTRVARDSRRRNYLRVRGEYYSRASQAGLMMELPPRARRIRTMATPP